MLYCWYSKAVAFGGAPKDVGLVVFKAVRMVDCGGVGWQCSKLVTIGGVGVRNVRVVLAW